MLQDVDMELIHLHKNLSDQFGDEANCMKVWSKVSDHIGNALSSLRQLYIKHCLNQNVFIHIMTHVLKREDIFILKVGRLVVISIFTLKGNIFFTGVKSTFSEGRHSRRV